MRKIVLLLLSTWIALNASGQGIEFFKGSFEDAIKKAQAENKQIFVDVYTSWCGPCKLMAKNVFTQKSVGDFFNRNFVNLKLDAEKESDNSFFKSYKASSYPSFFWLDAKGELLDIHSAYAEPSEFISLAKAANKSDLNKRLEAGKKRWDSGERTPELINEYVLGVLSKVNARQIQPLMMEYFKGLSEKQLKLQENYQFMRMFMRYADDNFVFNTMMENADTYEKYDPQYGFWINMYRMVVRGGIILRDEPEKYKEYIDFLKGMNTPLSEMYCQILEMEYNLFQKKFDKAIPEAMLLVDKYKSKHPYLAGQFYYTLIIANFFMQEELNENEANEVIELANIALKTVPSKENLLYLASAHAHIGDYKKAYELLASEAFFPQPMLSNALYKYLKLPVFHREYLK